MQRERERAGGGGGAFVGVCVCAWVSLPPCLPAAPAHPPGGARAFQNGARGRVCGWGGPWRVCVCDPERPPLLMRSKRAERSTSPPPPSLSVVFDPLPSLLPPRPHRITMASLMKPTPVTQTATRTVRGLDGWDACGRGGSARGGGRRGECFSFFFLLAVARPPPPAPAGALFFCFCFLGGGTACTPGPPPRPPTSAPLWLGQKAGDLMGEERQRRGGPSPRARGAGRRQAGSTLCPRRGAAPPARRGLSSSGSGPTPRLAPHVMPARAVRPGRHPRGGSGWPLEAPGPRGA